MNNQFVNIKRNLFELANMIEIKIDVGYVLEEMEEIAFEFNKLGEEGKHIHEEMMDIYNSFFKKYKNKLAAFLSPKESNLLDERIRKWLLKLPNLF